MTGDGFIHDKKHNRFYTVRDGLEAYVEYEIGNGALNITHTVVPKPLSGKGIAAGLVAEAYRYADASGLEKKAECSYAAIWLKRNT